MTLPLNYTSGCKCSVNIQFWKECRDIKVLRVCQDPKLREVLGFGKGDNVEGKLVTVVHSNDLVNISFLNFQAMQEDTAKVTIETTTAIL